MKKQLSALCPLSILLANSCAMAALFTVFSTVEGLAKTDPCLALWLCSISACHLAMSIFLRRKRSQRALIYFCAAFFMLQLVLAFIVYGRFSSVIGMLAAVCMWLYSYFNCFELHIKKTSVERYTNSFDICSLRTCYWYTFRILKRFLGTDALFITSKRHHRYHIRNIYRLCSCYCMGIDGWRNRYRYRSY